MIKHITKFKQTEIGPIPEEWKVLPFGKVARLKKKAYFPTGEDDLKYIGLEHIDQGTLSINGVGNSKDVKSNKFVFENGNILFGKLRPYFRKVYRPKFSGVCSTDIWVIEPQYGVDQGYLFYFVANQNFVDQASAGSGGTRMPRADWGHLEEMEWPVAPIEEQKQIAEILSALDDKIELNRKMNKTLEAIGQAIFKRWFVDFEFPNELGKPYKSSGGEMVDSELGEIPELWKVNSLSNLVVESQNGDWGKEVEQGIFTEPVLCIRGTDISNLAEGDMGRLPLRYIKKGSFDNKSLREGDIVIEISGGSPTQSTGRSVLVTNGLLARFKYPIICSNFCKVYRFKNVGIAYYVYSLLTILYKSGEFFQYENGTSGIKNFDATSFMNIYKVALSDKALVSSFTSLLTESYSSIQKNGAQNYLLSELRNSILPRLMSGKIRVK